MNLSCLHFLSLKFYYSGTLEHLLIPNCFLILKKSVVNKQKHWDFLIHYRFTFGNVPDYHLHFSLYHFVALKLNAFNNYTIKFIPYFSCVMYTTFCEHLFYVKYFCAGDDGWHVEQVLLGNTEVEVQRKTNLIRIFTSSTFTGRV